MHVTRSDMDGKGDAVSQACFALVLLLLPDRFFVLEATSVLSAIPLSPSIKQSMQRPPAEKVWPHTLSQKTFGRPFLKLIVV
jgi:hypothetical protein